MNPAFDAHPPGPAPADPDTATTPRPSFSWRATLGWLGSSAAIALLSLLVLPLSLPGIPPATRQRLSRALTVRFLRLFVTWMRGIRLYDFRPSPAADAVLNSLRNHPRGVLLVANHPTYIDAMYLLSRLEQPCVATKLALRRLPALGWVLRSCAWPANDHPLALHHQLLAELHAGHPVLVFPEGTRSPVGQPLGPLKAGAAVLLLARESGAPILPLQLEVNPRWPGHASSPWRPLARRMDYRIHAPAPEFVVASAAKPAAELPRLQRLLEPPAPNS